MIEKNSKDKRLLVTHGSGVYDVTSFAAIHPGGASYLSRFANKDITQVMDGAAHQHGPYAYRWMAQYRVGFVEHFPQITPPRHTLPSKDGFVDWAAPMIGQVGSLGPRYVEWLETPTDRPLRLFKSDFCEFFSNTKWYVVPIVWLPIVYLLLSRAAAVLSLFASIKFFTVGVLWWSFIEYTLHRFLFHLEPYNTSNAILAKLINNKYYITFHFLLHGQHHKVPFDKGRLVFPPVPAAVIVLLLRSLFQLTNGYYPGEALIAGGVFGYICYDMMHYYTHHGQMTKGSYLDRLRKYHIDHHFIDPTKGYGISSKLWDYPFQTAPSTTNNNNDRNNKPKQR